MSVSLTVIRSAAGRRRSGLSIGHTIHLHSSDQTSLNVMFDLAVNSSAHLHTSDKPLASEFDIAIAEDSRHQHISEAISITEYSAVTVEESTHDQSADASTLVEHAAIAAIDSAHVHLSDGVSIVDHAILGVAESTHVHMSGVSTVSEFGIVSAQDSLHTLASDDISVTEHATIDVNESTHTHIAGIATVAEFDTATVEDSLHTHSTENASVTEHAVLAIEESIHAHASDSAIASELDIAIPNDALHAHASGVVDISENASLTTLSSVHAHNSEEVATTENPSLIVLETAHAHITSVSTLTEDPDLSIESSTHLQKSAGAFIATDGQVSVGSSSHAQTSESVAVAENAVLVSADSAHTLTDTGASIVEHATLAVEQSEHAHMSDGLIVSEFDIAVPLDSLHSHTSDNASATEHAVLVVSESTHSHTSDNASATEHAVLVVSESIHAQTSETCTVAELDTVTAQDSLHSHASDNASVTEYAVLSVGESVHSHTTENASVSEFDTVLAQGSVHTHSADGISVTEHAVLSIMEAIHAHEAGTATVSEFDTAAVEDSLHAHASESAPITEHASLVPLSAQHAHTIDSVTVSEFGTVIVGESIHAHSVETSALTEHASVSAESSTHTHTADTAILVSLLSVEDSAHAHSAEEMVLVPMEAQYIASASSGSELSNTSSIALTKPAQVQEGDMLVAVVSHRWGIDGVTHPPGWTEIHKAPVPANWQWGALAYKVAGASEPSSYTWTGAVTGFSQVGLYVIRNPVEGGKLAIEDWTSSSLGGGTNNNLDPLRHQAGDLVSDGEEQRVFIQAHSCGWFGGSADYSSAGGTTVWGALNNNNVRCFGQYKLHTGSGDVSDLTITHDNPAHDAVAFSALIAPRPPSYTGPDVLAQHVVNVGGEGSKTTNGTLTLEMPETRKKKDIAIASVSGLNASSISTPSGWTQLEYHDAGNGNDYVWVGYRTLDGTESKNVSWTIGGSGDAAGVVGVMRGLGSLEASAYVKGGSTTPVATRTIGGTEVHIGMSVWTTTGGFQYWSEPMRMIGNSYESFGDASVIMGWRKVLATGNTSPANPEGDSGSSDAFVTLTFYPAVAVGDSTHSHAAEGVLLTEAATLSILDTAHSHIAASATVSEFDTAAIEDSIHAHVSDNVSITEFAALTSNASQHAHISDQVAISEFAASLVVESSTHAHTTDGGTLIPFIDNNLGGQAIDNNVFIAEVEDSTHSQISDNVETFDDAYEAIVMGDTPIAYWRLGESSGTTAASRTGAHNGTYSSTPTLGAPGLIKDTSDTAVSLNRSSEHVYIGNASALRPANFSIEAWIKLDALPDGAAIFAEAYIASKVNYTLGFGSTIGAASGNKPFFGWYNAGWTGVIDSIDIDIGIVHHIVGTYDGTTMRLYVDSAEVASGAPTKSLPADAHDIYIGRRWDTGGTQDYIDGTIDEVAFYDYALTLQQIQDHYVTGAADDIITGAVAAEVLTRGDSSRSGAVAAEVLTRGDSSRSGAVMIDVLIEN